MTPEEHERERQAFNRRAQWEMLRQERVLRAEREFNQQARVDLRKRVWSSLLARWAADSAQSRR